MSIAVIGGSGFIGSRLVKRLTSANIHQVAIFDKVVSRSFPGLTTVGDVRSTEDLRRGIPQGSIIVNLAAEHRDDVRPRSLYDEVNVKGALNICAVAREREVNTIIFTSTVAVYGFAPIGTDESGEISPFNDYGRTKFEAEIIFRAWQNELPQERTLVIIRPVVVFGEQNRGNVYNLLRQIVSDKFLMIGDGNNRKSMGYVENVAAFIEFSLKFNPGIHIFNYADKPDYTMNDLVAEVRKVLGRSGEIGLRLPYRIGYLIGKGFDIVSAITGRRTTISSIRVKKFCSNSVFSSAIGEVNFQPPVPLRLALEKTVQYEFLESHEKTEVFYTE